MIARLLSLILQPANIYTVGVTAKIGLLHLKSVAPGWGLTFSSYPLRLAKIAFTPEELGHTPEEYGFTPEEFCEN